MAGAFANVAAASGGLIIDRFLSFLVVLGFPYTADFAINLHVQHAELQAIIALRDAEIETRDRKLSIFAAEIQERDYRIEKLKHELAGLRRHRFGSRSEALDQLELTLEEEEIARAATTPPGEDDKADQTNGEKRKPRRKPLPEHLHRNEQVLSPGEACNACGGSLKTLGEDVTEELEYVPGRFVVNRIIRPVAWQAMLASPRRAYGVLVLRTDLPGTAAIASH